MIKLSDYLNYLNNEVIQARKMADIQAITIAKEYAAHEYLKYFRVPRFSMPMVKLNIPIKINELDADVSYNFKRDYDSFVADVNDKITKVNLTHNYNIRPLSKNEILENKEFIAVFDKLEKYDYMPVKKLDDNLSKIDLNHISEILSKKLSLSTSDNQETRIQEKLAYKRILKDSITNRFTLVHADLNNIYIDPDTSKETDKGKILLTLDVEMIEEGIRIRKVKDKNGKEVEEILFE